ncbi:MAG: Na/Pi cotransporter family protein [Microcoleus sp. SIO2G3]|nr:Na/Pi cotransporter family protein [Microcoleus sp. SIO2G3]
MSFFKQLNPKIARCLAITLFALTLVLFPPNLNQSFPFVAVNSIAVAQSPETSSAAESSGSDSPTTPHSPQEEETEEAMNFFQMAMGAIAGLVLFIYGVTRLSEGLEDLGGSRMKNFLGKFTTNRFAGVATGIVATTLLESSSVTIIMVIAMVSAGILTFVQSLGVVLGSNIGTAVGAQIISLNIELYVPILMFAGLLVLFLGRNKRQRSIGLVLLGFGLLFYGLEAIDAAMEPFREYEPFLNWMESLGRNPILGALVGALFTVIVQSSSATVAIVITLASSGLIGLPAGIALMLGAEVGTCADTLLATIGRGRPALRTGVFHFGFNLISAIIGIIFAAPLAALVQNISGDYVGRQIANAQMLFNIIGVIAVIGFLPLIARALERFLPETPADRQRQERQAEKHSENDGNKEAATATSP